MLSVTSMPMAEPASAVEDASLAGVSNPVYVVDQNHPKASDTNPGTAAAPWKTIGKAAATAKAGDTVCIMDGDYAERVKPANSGVENKPIVFKGLPRQTVKMRGFDTTGCNYLSIESFFITATDVGVNVNSDHVEIVDNRFENVETVPIDVPSSNTDKPANIHVAFNEIYHCGKGMVTGGSNWLVERNEVNRLFCYDKGDADYFRPWGTNMTFRQNYLHGSTKVEIKGSHTDCFQVFDDNGELAQDILLEENVCCDYGQNGLIMENHKPGNMKNFTVRRNIFPEYNPEWPHGGVGGSCPGFVVEGNTFVGGGHSFSTSSGCRFENNIFYCGVYWFTKTAQGFSSQKNLIYYTTEKVPVTGMSHIPTDYSKNVMNADPLFQDLAKRNVRVKKGSPVIAAGVDGVTIGALEYPNTYYVDARHAGASDENCGYAGAPYKTIAKAFSVAEEGETIIVRGGVYRELLKPTKSGVKVRSAKGEKVTISCADEITDWKRQGDKWTAPLGTKPAKIFKDAQPFKEFSYDDAAKTIVVSGFDPRLCLMETVTRQNPIDLSRAPGMKIEGIEADARGAAGTVR